jgi:hypothetical protein
MLSVAWKMIGLGALVVPAMGLRWYARFRDLRSPDPDLGRARQDVRIALGIFLMIAIAAILLDPALNWFRLNW